MCKNILFKKKEEVPIVIKFVQVIFRIHFNQSVFTITKKKSEMLSSYN